MEKAKAFLGQRIYPTALGLGAKRQTASRRTRSFAVIEAAPGLTYEEYVKAGGDPQDLSIIVNRRKHAITLPADAPAPKAPPVVEDPKGLVPRTAPAPAPAKKAAPKKAAAKKATPKKKAAAKHKK